MKMVFGKLLMVTLCLALPSLGADVSPQSMAKHLDVAVQQIAKLMRDPLVRINLLSARIARLLEERPADLAEQLTRLINAINAKLASQKARVELLDTALEHWSEVLSDEAKAAWPAQLEDLDKNLWPKLRVITKGFAAGSGLVIKDIDALRMLIAKGASRDELLAAAAALHKKTLIGDKHFQKFVDDILTDFQHFVESLKV